MRKKGGLWAFGWILLGLLVLSSGLLVLGSRERVSQPSATSYGPSGTRILAELLRDAGYRVEVSRLAKPKLAIGDLAIGFIVYDPPTPFGQASRTQEDTPTKKTLRAHLENGGRAIVLHVPFDFVAASKVAHAENRRVTVPTSINGSTLEVSQGDTYHQSSDLIGSEMGGYTIGSAEDGQSWLRIFAKGKGLLGVVYDATGATNRFIDRAGNANAFDRVIRFFAPTATARIVFLEALHSTPIDPGLMASIGTWASAAWWQLIVLFLLVCYTLGKRFGLPEFARHRQRGGRELVDAYSDVVSRANKPQIALKKIVKEADREIRKRFSISADLPPKRRNETLPPQLAAALSRAELATESNLSDSSAVRLLWDLEFEFSKVTGQPMRHRKRKKR